MSETRHMIDLMANEFNNFKNTIDRKYGIYEIFRYVPSDTGYRVEKMIGSNQILLYRDEALIYNSDSEGELTNSERYTEFMVRAVNDVKERRS